LWNGSNIEDMTEMVEDATLLEDVGWMEEEY
jgi:hypothetical protein